MLQAIARSAPVFANQEWFAATSTSGCSQHSVVVAASGAALCSCLNPIRTGMLCRHIIACLPRVTVIPAGGAAEAAGPGAGEGQGVGGASMALENAQLAPPLPIQAVRRQQLQCTACST